MAARSKRWPKYCGPHPGKVYAYCWWQGKKIYFPPHPFGSPESWHAYERWCRANVEREDVAFEDGSIASLVLQFLIHAQSEYGGPKSSEFSAYRIVCDHLLRFAGDDLLSEFGPRRFRAFLAFLEEQGRWNATTLRKMAGKTKRIIKWGVSHECVRPEQLVALQTVEYTPRSIRPIRVVEPVEWRTVVATLRQLNPTVAAMVRIQARTGMRSANLCELRAREIDQTREVWQYTPSTHKTAHKGKSLTIFLGPRTQRILAPRLATAEPGGFLFVPQGPNPDTRDHYRPSSYRQAILRAARRAGVAPWHPHQLRHTVATVVRAEMGVEAAQVFLGHAHASTTQLYAERSAALAERVARKFS